MRDKLVAAMLPHAAFDGWSQASMAAAAAELGLDPTMPVRLFPGGPAETVARWVAMADARMAVAMAEAGLEQAGVGQKVFSAVRLRLEPWAEHREAVRRAASLLALPAHVGLAARLSWNTADALWRAAGDQSADFSWYTRRATLTAVYTATLLFWLDDSSEECAETWAFLKRRLDEVRAMPKLRQGVEAWLGGLKPDVARLGVGLAQSISPRRRA